MELRRYFRILRRYAAVILVCVIVGAVVGFFTTSRAKRYVSTAVIFVEPSAIGRNPSTNALTSDPLVAAGIVSVTFGKMIESTPTPQLAVQQAGLPRTPAQVRSETNAAPVINTSPITVTVTDRDPSVAQATVNAVSNAFVTEVKGLEPPGPYYDPQPVTVFEPAVTPGGLLSHNLGRQLLIFAGLGLLAGILLSLLLDYTDLTVRGGGDAQRRLRLPVLGTVPVGRVHV